MLIFMIYYIASERDYLSFVFCSEHEYIPVHHKYFESLKYNDKGKTGTKYSR